MTPVYLPSLPPVGSAVPEILASTAVPSVAFDDALTAAVTQGVVSSDIVAAAGNRAVARIASGMRAGAVEGMEPVRGPVSSENEPGTYVQTALDGDSQPPRAEQTNPTTNSTKMDESFVRPLPSKLRSSPVPSLLPKAIICDAKDAECEAVETKLPEQIYPDVPAFAATVFVVPPEPKATVETKAGLIEWQVQSPVLQFRPPVSKLNSDMPALAQELPEPNFTEIGKTHKDFDLVVSVALPEAPQMAKTFDRPALNLLAENWVEYVAREVMATFEHQAESGPLRFKLTPKHLGVLEVEIATKSDGLVIDLSATTAEAARIVEVAEPRLVDELRSRGISLSESTLHFGANGDGNPHRNGAILRAVLPSNEAGREAAKDQDQLFDRPKGRFA